MAVTEPQARAVLLLQSLESLPESPTWSADDSRWATRAAAQGLPDDAAREALIVERARLAAQRLAGRDAGLRQWLAARPWRATWSVAAVGLGLLLGGVSDALVSGTYFNLLSPLFWGLLAWNVAVYAGIAMQALVEGRGGSTGGGLRRLVARWVRPRAAGVWPRVAADWAAASGPLWLARAAALLHALAAGLALGAVAGLLLRGLVLDYRAGWATTLLAPETVRAALTLGLQPAWALTGLPAPDAAAFEALRVVAGQPALASAAPWIVLMAAQLMVVVVVPRMALAAWAGWRARRLAADFPIALDGAAFDRWLPARAPGGAGAAAEVWLLPQGRAPDAASTAALRTLVEGAWGGAARLTLADAVPWGEEDQPPMPPPGARVLLLVDLATTPEAEVHCRLLQALGAASPLVLADEHAFVQRFGRAERLDQRRQAWRALLGEHPFVGVDLGAADLAPATRAIQAALSEHPGARYVAPGKA